MQVAYGAVKLEFDHKKSNYNYIVHVEKTPMFQNPFHSVVALLYICIIETFQC